MSSMGMQLDIRPVLEYYGVTNPPHGPGWRPVRCPFHDDKTASAGSNGKGFKCQACGVKGDAISLIREREDLDYQDSVRKYEEISGRSYGSLSKAIAPKRRRPLSDEPRDYERNSGLFSLGIRRRPDSGS